jgi:DNA repair protein RadC
MMMRLRELIIRYSAGKDSDGQPVLIGRTVERAADAAPTLLSLLQDEAAEVFIILCLSTKRRVIGFHRVSRGTLDSTPVHPREVFKVALLANAGAIILAHNHPSGDPTPSRDDVQLTRRIVHAGKIIGIDVIDHIVVGDGRWTSLHDLGLLVASGP